MEILLLGIYSFFVWLIVFKLKWVPWNFLTQVIVITIPIVFLTLLILLLNIVAPSSADVRVINYVIPINPPVRGLVIEVPIEPNRPLKKGDVLFRIDPTPFQIAVSNYEAQISQLRVQLVTAQATTRNLQEQLKGSTGQKAAIESKLKLSRMRMQQFKELADSGAGSKFDYEQAQADAQNLEGQLATTVATEAQAREKLGAKTPEGEQDEI